MPCRVCALPSVRDSMMKLEEIRSEKRRLRAQYKSLRASLSPDKRESMDVQMLAELSRSLCIRYAKSVLVYASFGSEPDTFAISERMLASGKRLYFPKSYPGGVMRFFRVNALSELQKGAFGVPEPDEGAEPYVPGPGADVCLVPGVCFDVYGYRIGYGKGYYDRFLSDFPGVSIGLVYSELLRTQLLAREKRYDRCVDLILTEKGTRARVCS